VLLAKFACRVEQQQLTKSAPDLIDHHPTERGLKRITEKLHLTQRTGRGAAGVAEPRIRTDYVSHLRSLTETLWESFRDIRVKGTWFSYRLIWTDSYVQTCKHVLSRI